MLRSSLNSVLSSISTRSRLSTRLFCATATSTDDQITTVRATGIRWNISDDRGGSMIGVYWGENDPRNQIIPRKYMTTSAVDPKIPILQSIFTTLHDARKRGMKRIRVQTDLNTNEFDIRQEAQKFERKHVTKAETLNSIPMLCTKIVRFMDEMDVNFEYLPFKRYGRNQLIALLNKEKAQKFPDWRKSQCFMLNEFTPNDAFPLKGRIVPTVYVAAGLHYSNTEGASASVWVRESIDHLEKEQRPIDSTKRLDLAIVTKIRVEYAAILEAIKEAQALNLPEILIATSFINFIPFFSDDWLKPNGRLNSHEDLYLEIKALTEKTKVHFKTVQVDSDDEFMKKAQEMAKNPWKKPTDDTRYDLSSSDHLSNKTITPSGVLPLERRIVPTVYVRGKNEFGKTGLTVSLWVPESIEHLDVKERPLGSIERLTIYPVTNFRAQLMAILNAIKEAQTYNLREIQVATDCHPFLHYFTTDWKNPDGSSPAFENMYLEIKALTEKTKVHFKGVRIAENPDDEFLKKVHEMAKEALKSPVQKQVDER